MNKRLHAQMRFSNLPSGPCGGWSLAEMRVGCLKLSRIFQVSVFESSGWQEKNSIRQEKGEATVKA